MDTKYSIWKGVYKALINIAIVAGPLLIQILPEEWANLTLSGAILLFVNYLKVTIAAKAA